VRLRQLPQQLPELGVKVVDVLEPLHFVPVGLEQALVQASAAVDMPQSAIQLNQCECS
jgi:hypothetical protein